MEKIENDFDAFVEKYKAVSNHVTHRKEFDGTFFETFGVDLDFVRTQANKNTVWTLTDCDDKSIVQSGMLVVNRLGYFISEVPHDGSHIEFALDDAPDTDDIPESTLLVQNAAYKVDGYFLRVSWPQLSLSAEFVKAQHDDFLGAWLR